MMIYMFYIPYASLLMSFDSCCCNTVNSLLVELIQDFLSYNILHRGPRGDFDLWFIYRFYYYHNNTVEPKSPPPPQL